ncbi:PIN domain-containing protein [Flectobacillus roseus]|uniref:PIN domain-containing protein n=1 Tax=Flectobacillus roseus TaxID=502259 RepID=A0ABT6Y6Z4_9BACT|nr:hypothetical protein [Flectobacillus roseus]MDI9859335.1 hypothetical protein [Flectobacillus roseus]
MISDAPEVSGSKTPLKKIAINDANLFIDLCDINLITQFFQLPIEFHTTQLIIEELEKSQFELILPYIKQKILYIRELTLDEITGLSKLTLQSRKLSKQDLSIYFYAKEIIDCMILTGDNKLRKEAIRQGFEVHGILWVLIQLEDYKIIQTKEAIDALSELMSLNQWLPVDECQKILNEWDMKSRK